MSVTGCTTPEQTDRHSSSSGWLVPGSHHFMLYYVPSSSYGRILMSQVCVEIVKCVKSVSLWMACRVVWVACRWHGVIYPSSFTTEHHPYHNIRLEMERPDNDTHSATLQQEDHFNSTVVFVIKRATLILNKCNCILMMDMVFQNDGHLIQLTQNNVMK